ncbi:MAG: tripartite tricarboxylate transporter substrate binding protein [Herbaspirillum sp.]|nr:tripartite tricarboxylate transporter substrate binding protein [Herbaspirillum sp.]
MNLFSKLLVLLSLSACACAAQAQSYPSKPIHLVVNFPPGGPSDIIGRLLAEKLSTILGKPVIVDNHGGASGTIGADYVAKASPDGYTLLITPQGALTTSAALMKLPYDPIKDLAPISKVVTVQSVLVVPPKPVVQTVAALVARVKSRPGKISFASTGSGNMTHLAGEMLKQEAGIDIVHVPYRGAAPAVTDLIGGHVDMMFVDLPVALPYIESGKLVALAVASEKRSPSLPNVPTTAEVGYPKLLGDNWYALLAPGGTPPEIITKLNQSVVTALKMPDLQARIEKMGALPVGDSPEKFGAFLRSEIATLVPFVKKLGVKAD